MEAAELEARSFMAESTTLWDYYFIHFIIVLDVQLFVLACARARARFGLFNEKKAAKRRTVDLCGGRRVVQLMHFLGCSPCVPSFIRTALAARVGPPLPVMQRKRSKERRGHLSVSALPIRPRVGVIA